MEIRCGSGVGRGEQTGKRHTLFLYFPTGQNFVENHTQMPGGGKCSLAVGQKEEEAGVNSQPGSASPIKGL